MANGKATTATPIGKISNSIVILRGRRALLDAGLAALYGVPTKRLIEQVKRNAERFPEDFMLQLTADESNSLRWQFAILKTGRGLHRKYRPYVFTEHDDYARECAQALEVVVRSIEWVLPHHWRRRCVAARKMRTGSPTNSLMAAQALCSASGFGK